MSNLAQVCRLLGTTDIVLTSSWRKGWSRDTKRCTPQVKALVDRLSQSGLAIVGRTGEFGDRHKEILDYCERHEIDTYLILDDDSSELTRFFDIDKLHHIEIYPNIRKRER